MGIKNHRSHGLGEALTGRPGTNHKGDITRMSPKRAFDVMVNPAMRATPRSGGSALSGPHASAIDALSGATVVPGAVKSAPGWGNATTRTGSPFATAPGSKRLTEPKPSWDCKDGDGNDCGDLADLGRAVLAEAAIGHRGKR